MVDNMSLLCVLYECEVGTVLTGYLGTTNVGAPLLHVCTQLICCICDDICTVWLNIDHKLLKQMLSVSGDI